MNPNRVLQTSTQQHRPFSIFSKAQIAILIAPCQMTTLDNHFLFCKLFTLYPYLQDKLLEQPKFNLFQQTRLF